MTIASSKSRANQKLTPQQRAIEKKRALLREFRASDFDPDTYDWQKHGEYFDNLSDDEWAGVWKHVRFASHREPLPDEARVRELVDDAAISSGWFAEWGGELHFSRADYHGFAIENRRFLKKIQQFCHDMADFFGAPPCDHKEPYDPWARYRPVIPALDHLSAVLERKITEDEHNASSADDPPNAAKPELDAWRAGLMLVWQNECRLPIENSKSLRGFLIAALRPYVPGQTDRMAKHFITKWLAGKVTAPPMSLRQLFGDK